MILRFFQQVLIHTFNPTGNFFFLMYIPIEIISAPLLFALHLFTSSLLSCALGLSRTI